MKQEQMIHLYDRLLVDTVPKNTILNRFLANVSIVSIKQLKMDEKEANVQKKIPFRKPGELLLKKDKEQTLLSLYQFPSKV